MFYTRNRSLLKSVELAKWQLVVFLEAPQRGEWADGIFFNLETFQSRLEHAQSAFQCKAYSASSGLTIQQVQYLQGIDTHSQQG